MSFFADKILEELEAVWVLEELPEPLEEQPRQEV